MYRKRMKASAVAALLGTAITVSPGARADGGVTPVGGEFEILPGAGGISLDGSWPFPLASTASNAAGDYVVASWCNPDNFGSDSICAQAFHFDGTPITSMITVAANQNLGSFPHGPSVSINNQGEFAVAWSAYGAAVVASIQRYTADGVPAGAPISIPAPLIDDVPVIALNDDGLLAVAWPTEAEVYYKGKGCSSDAIHTQLYSSSDTAIGTSHLVSSSFGCFAGGGEVGSGYFVSAPAVAFNTTGKYLVSWDKENGLTHSQVILGHFYTGQGKATGLNLSLATSPIWVGTYRLASVANGDFALVWAQTAGTSSTPSNVVFRTFSATGLPKIAPTTVAVGCNDPQNLDIGSDGQENFLVAWSSSDTSLCYGNIDVHARRYDSSGNPLTDAFVVSPLPNTADSNYSPAIVIPASGTGFIVTWSNTLTNDTEHYRVEGQRYSAP